MQKKPSKLQPEKEHVHSLHDAVSFVDKKGQIPEEDREKYIEFVLDLAENDREETNTYTSSKQWIDRILKLRKKYKIHPRKAQIKHLYLECLSNGRILESHSNLEQYLTIRQSRTLSGVLVIAVLMSPYPVYYDKKKGVVKQQKFSCAHNCYYCPNEPGMPRSYLSKEAAVSRAVRAEFDAIDQFYSRANTLQKLGHTVDKIELMVLGGTFCQFPREYQESFIRDLYWSANTFFDGNSDFQKKRARLSLSQEIKIHETATKCRIIGLTLETRPDSIKDFDEIARFRMFGATRLQIGVQHIDDEILKYINRGCYNRDTIQAIRMLKNSGYKIDIHLMPNLPSATPDKDKRMFEHLLKDDLIQCDQWKVYPCQTVDFTLIQKWYQQGIYKPYSLEQLMEVIITLKSKIHPWIRLNRIFRSLPEENITSGITMTNFRQHLYHKMNEAGLVCKCIRCREVGTHIRRADLAVADLKKMAQQQKKMVAEESEEERPAQQQQQQQQKEKKEDVAVNMNPAHSVLAAQMSLRGKLSKCVQIKHRRYASSGGEEVFISIESIDGAVLYGFVRVRLPPVYIRPEDRAKYGLRANQAFLNGFDEKLRTSNGNYGSEVEYQQMIEVFPQLYRAALVREAHVYGSKTDIKHVNKSDDQGSSDYYGDRNEVRKQSRSTGQSKGYGQVLMVEAERIAKQHGYSRVAVIAGVGTRLYYRLKLGYVSDASYMVKDIDTNCLADAMLPDESALDYVERMNRTQGGLMVAPPTVGVTHKQQNVNKLKLSMVASVFVAAGFYIAVSTFLSILLAFVVCGAALAYFNYLHFVRIRHAKTVNKSLLSLSRIAMMLIDGAFVCRFCSAFFPRLGGIQVPYIVRELVGGADNNDGGQLGSCYCQTFWSLALVFYVSSVYILKAIYHKRVIIMVQHPMFGNDSGIRSVPFSIACVLFGQMVAFSLCQFLMINYVRGYCNDEMPLPPPYDTSQFGCRDTFDPVGCYVAFAAIAFDAVMFSLFCSKWYALMLIFMEEMAFSLLLQFMLPIIGMLSCVVDGCIHLYFYFTRPYFDSFMVTSAFLVDCCVIALCLTLSFSDAQKFLAQKVGITNLTKYYQKLENLGYSLHIM